MQMINRLTRMISTNKVYGGDCTDIALLWINVAKSKDLLGYFIS